ncbi:MAG: carbon-nitrogen hydrolase family protein [Pseudomonadota bacterium]|jgi:deaminated glutathione amidase
MQRAAAIQLRGTGSLRQRLARAAELIDAAAGRGAGLVVLPENFAYFGATAQQLAAAAEAEQDARGPARALLAECARRHRVWILGGTLPLTSGLRGDRDPKPYAAALLYDDQGEEVARYHKIHLFDVVVRATGHRYCESDSFRPGADPVVVHTPFGKLGISVCYDLRFPELYRGYAARGAELIAVPSAFTATTGAAHWLLLLRARAVENQCYLIGANIGDRRHPKRPTWGGSAIVDPWGEVLAELEDGDGVIVADLDPERLARVRGDMPALDHRRL